MFSNNTMVTINMLSLPINFPSLCIPRVFQNITREKVFSIIEQLELGEIERIDMVQKVSNNDDKFQRVFIHFTRWNSSPESLKTRQYLLSGNIIKIVYQDPWFWKVSANHSISHNIPSIKNEKNIINSDTKPFIDFSDSNSENDTNLCNLKQSKKLFEDDTGFIVQHKYNKKINKNRFYDKNINECDNKKNTNQFLPQIIPHVTRQFIPHSPPNSPPRSVL